MSNYVDPDATRVVDLGPCRCPVEPPPHERDSADVVKRYGYGELARIRQAGRFGGIEAMRQMAILLGVKRWTFVLPDGSARPINSDQVARLDETTVDLFMDPSEDHPGVLDESFASDPLPNVSGAPSPDGLQESAGPAPTTNLQPTSTNT